MSFHPGQARLYMILGPLSSLTSHVIYDIILSSITHRNGKEKTRTLCK
jgi:hypothetical protein